MITVGSKIKNVKTQEVFTVTQMLAQMSAVTPGQVIPVLVIKSEQTGEHCVYPDIIKLFLTHPDYEILL